MSRLTHIDEKGQARMVDVGDKPETRRQAVAEGRISMRADTLADLIAGNNKKGDVLGAARLAGIMAAKQASTLIPLCHPLRLDHVSVELTPDEDTPGVHCRARVETTGRTGVEIEALAAVQTALLTVYDMCKAAERGMCIEAVRLAEKSGGRSGNWKRET